jgi:hexosaminidase
MAYRKNLHRCIIPAILFTVLLLVSCTSKVPTDLSKNSIIPKPVSIVSTGESFKIKPTAMIFVKTGSDEAMKTGNYLAERLRPATGFNFDVMTTEKDTPSGNIYLALSDDNTINGPEGYKLDITKKMVTLTALQPEGLFNGVQTLLQLFPPDIEMKTTMKGPWEIATGTITDYPVYSYRGVMLDVSRHFFSADDVKHLIDLISYYKMNFLHLHLSDDQGWRIEIKSWPELALHGGSTEVGGGKGGYYTQEQYTDIVIYAKERYITIVPEIDMPGHTNAALASYAKLNCSGKAPKLYTGTDVGFSSLCTKKDITYKFIDDVVRELSAITPGPYIHIGGDESHSTKREDYIPFINKVQDIVISHGKKVIGWDDIAIGSLRPGVVAQHWANIKNADAAIAQGAKILMSPAAKAYLDMQYDSTTRLGLHWAAYIRVDSAYMWDPATMVPGVKKDNIIGIEAPLWTETITNMDDIEYMVFPRLPGYAEIGWTSASSRSWDEYKVRLANQGSRFKALGIDYYPSPRINWSGNN